MILQEFKKTPILGILRNIGADSIEGVLEASINAGLKAIEVTMNTPNACNIIKRACRLSKKRIFVGAGTVLSLDELKRAVDAGASFIVSPCVIDDIVDYCVEKRLPVFPGCLSPSEVFNAYKKGATMVKVFPAACFGPGYFKQLKGPFNNIELLACGGINKENIKAYFSAGASAVAFGDSIFNKALLLEKDFAAIEASIKGLIKAKEA
jgi:2-dehydro-3-deoxyphosphogluconate aldolase / (4S)-4-hydroxy-2-oxoglutarate aldolase